MTERQAITAVATAGVCVCQQVRKLYPATKQDIYEEMKGVESAIEKLLKKAGTRLNMKDAETLSNKFSAFFKSIAEVK